MGEYEPNDSRNVTGANNQGTDASISQSSTQGHGQDPGMRGQASGQHQQSGSGGGQMGGQNDGGQAGQFESDPQHASELNQQARPGGGQQGGQEAQDRASGGESALASQIREHMEVIGADGVHVGTVDHVDGDRIKLTKRDSGAGYEGGQHTGHHHYLSIGLVAGIEGDTVRLSANAAVAYGMEEEEDQRGADGSAA